MKVGDLAGSRRVRLASPGVTEGDYPLISTPCQLLVKEGWFPLAHSRESPIAPQDWVGPSAPPWGTDGD